MTPLERAVRTPGLRGPGTFNFLPRPWTFILTEPLGLVNGGLRMKCPHCLVEVNPGFVENYIGQDRDGAWALYYMKCPRADCARLIIHLVEGDEALVGGRHTIRPVN